MKKTKDLCDPIEAVITKFLDKFFTEANNILEVNEILESKENVSFQDLNASCL